MTASGRAGAIKTGRALLVAALVLAGSDAAAQARARAAAEASITLMEPGGLRRVEGADSLTVAVSEAPGAGYQLVTPERVVSGSLVIETADRLRRGEGQGRVSLGASIQGATASGEVGLLPVTAVFD